MRMVRTFVDALTAEGDPIHVLNKTMGGKRWNITFSRRDVADLQCFLQLMGPLEKLFTELNAEFEPTIHLLFPTIKVKVKIVHP